MLTLLWRGVRAGAIGGALAGSFGFLLAEPVMDHAVRLESARQHAITPAGMHTVDIFSRHTQHLGFVGATFFVGVSLGVLLSVFARLTQAAGQDPWATAIRLGAGGFFALSLVPFLRYPSNPPGVGDPGTIDMRSHLWTVTLVIGLVGSCTAGLMARQLAARGTRTSTRQLAVVAVLIATVAITFVLPADPDQIAVPVGLLWQFRLLSLAALALLWGGLAAAYGLLGARARVRDSVAG